MSWLRIAFLVLTLIALSSPSEEIAFRVAADTTLARTLESEYSMQLASMTFTMNGEELPSDAFGEVDIQIDHSESFVVTDAFEAVADGRPQRLRRTFDELGGRESSSFTSEEGEANDASDYQSALEGKTVVFTWNGDEERFDAVFAAGLEGDQSLLDELEEDMDLRRWLPAGELAEGESWSVDARAFACILDPGGDLGLEDTEGEEADTSAQDAELRANLAGTITATLTSTREEDGVKQAVIALEVDTHTHTESALGPDELPGGGRGTRRVEVRFLLAGELRWDLVHGHALILELSGENGLESVETITGEFEGERLEQAQTMVFAGETRFSMRVERR